MNNVLGTYTDRSTSGRTSIDPPKRAAGIRAANANASSRSRGARSRATRAAAWWSARTRRS
jgi:hypothetical protein